MGPPCQALGAAKSCMGSHVPSMHSGTQALMMTRKGPVLQTGATSRLRCWLQHTPAVRSGWSQGGFTISFFRSRLRPELPVCTPVLPMLFKLQTLQGRGFSCVHSMVININPYDLQTAWLSGTGMISMQNRKGLARCFMSPGDSLACSNVYLASSHRCDQSK